MAKEVGIGSYSNHFLQRSRREGADFNLLVIGPAGCGKSTLLSNVYNQEILPADRRRYTRVPNGVEFIEHEAEVSEAGVALRLKVTEVLGYGELSFGFGSAQSQREKIQKIVKNVEDKHRKFFDSENYAKRSINSPKAPTKDQLYHAAVVFIQPQRNLNVSPIDIALLQALQARVNVIPVIAKADSYIGEELCRIKANLKRAFSESKILLFPNITDVSDDDWVIKEAVEVRSHCPFLTIAAQPENGVRLRQYPWGLISIDAPFPRSNRPNSANSSHSLTLTASASRILEQTECCGNDLHPMQKMLIRSHLEFLKRHTVEKLYETYRTEMVCNVQLAPEAPMRLNKSRAPESNIQQTQKMQESEPENVDDEVFQSTQLDPIREEDEPVTTKFDLSASFDNLTGAKASKKNKNKNKTSTASINMKVSAEKLDEAHDELVSPLPSIQ